MRNLMVICFCVFFSCGTYSQTICSKDSTRYVVAYNYINNEKVNREKMIIVTDSIVDLDRFWFSNDATGLLKDKIDQHRINKKFIWNDTFYSSCLNFLFPTKKKKTLRATHVLFFSEIEDDMLCADLIFCRRLSKMQSDMFNYQRMATLNSGRIYLFVFDKGRNTIKSVFSHEMSYD